MSSVTGGLNNIPKKSYIACEAPNGHLYSYSRTYNAATYTWTGALTAIDFSASPYNVPGIVFRETGKKLYADANPGVDRYMVGVFIIDQDGYNVAGELGSMFIDPNCSVFAQFNGQRPTYIPTAQDHDFPAGNLDLGNPVYTRGDITTTAGDVVVTAGNITATAGNITATAGNIVATAGSISAGTTVTATTTVTGATLKGTQNFQLTDTRSIGTATIGGSGSVTVTTAAALTTSRIIISPTNSNGVNAYVSAKNAGSFVITGTSAGTVDWLIINIA